MAHTDDVMRVLTRSRTVEGIEPWVNADTAQVDAWLTEEDVKPITRRLVYAWNEGSGLAVELADELQDLVHARLAEVMSPFRVRRRLRNVNWNQLAEQYALMFLGITEEQLTERRKKLLQ